MCRTRARVTLPGGGDAVATGVDGSLVPTPIAVRIVMTAWAGLHAAHALRDGHGQLIGLVHRDVSPQNILVTYDGVTKVVDFGVAKATAMGGGATVAGQLKDAADGFQVEAPITQFRNFEHLEAKGRDKLSERQS